jgi:hypothetical protein
MVTFGRLGYVHLRVLMLGKKGSDCGKLIEPVALFSRKIHR